MQAVQATKDAARAEKKESRNKLRTHAKKLSAEARAEKRSSKQAAKFAAADKDSDGNLNLEEFIAATGTTKKKKHHRGAKRSNLKKQFDTDGDGSLSEEEIGAIKAELKARVRGERIADKFSSPTPNTNPTEEASAE